MAAAEADQWVIYCEPFKVFIVYYYKLCQSLKAVSDNIIAISLRYYGFN